MNYRFFFLFIYWISFLELCKQIRRLRWDISRKYFFPKPAIRVDEQQVLKEIAELKWARDKAFANAPVEGKTWNSLASKTVIKQQIKVTN